MDDVTVPKTPAGPQPGEPIKPDMLPRALQRRASERFSGVLVIEGHHRGTVLMRDGRIVAATTPAAPGPEALILRSGRIPEPEWSEAYSAAAPEGRLAEELVSRGLLGAAGIEVLTQTAVVDAVFAMALSGVQRCVAEPADPGSVTAILPSEPGMDVERVTRELTRRLAQAAQWQQDGLRIDSRPRPVTDREIPPLSADRRAILAKANGRRTSRDLAFALGRGVFSTMTDLAALLADGLITLQPRQRPPGPAEPAPDRDPGNLSKLIHWRRKP